MTRIHNGKMRKREREREIRKEWVAAQAFIALQANKAATTQTTTINGNALRTIEMRLTFKYLARQQKAKGKPSNNENSRTR